MHIRCIITSHVNTWPSSYTINLTTSQEMGKNLELYVTMIKVGDHEFLHDLVIKSIQLTTCNLITLTYACEIKISLQTRSPSIN